MAFSNKNDDSAMSEINVTPLVDVMLVLLIIFIVTAPLLTQSINVNLPETTKTPPADNLEDHVVTVELNLNNQITLSKKEWKEVYSIDDTERIKQVFKSILEKDKELVLAFSADTKLEHGKVMRIIALAQNEGITKLSFLTTEEKQ